MIYAFILTILLGRFLSIIFHELTNLSTEAHRLCLMASPQGPWQEYYQAIVCGGKIKNIQAKEAMKQIGVIHIMIVSGAHLHFLSNLIRYLLPQRIAAKVEIFLLFVFVCCTEFQMPALRAWLHRIISLANERLKLFYPPSVCLLLSLVLCLSLDIDEYHRYSLLLSWLACLGLYFGRNHLTQSMACYVILAPVINNFNPLNPLSILVNTLYAPLIGLIVFPASLLAFLFSPFQILTDKIWHFIHETNHLLSTMITTPHKQATQTSLFYIWFFALLLNLWLTFKENKKRKSFCPE